MEQQGAFGLPLAAAIWRAVVGRAGVWADLVEQQDRATPQVARSTVRRSVSRNVVDSLLFTVRWQQQAFVNRADGEQRQTPVLAIPVPPG